MSSACPSLPARVPEGWRLRYLYVGTDDLQRSLVSYLQGPQAHKAWHFKRDGTEVAAVRPGQGPLVLLASHRPPGSCVPMFSVPHLDATGEQLKAHGWQPKSDPFGIPPGPCQLFQDPTGNEFGIFEEVRPHAMESAYADPTNRAAVRR
ncbi:MAG: hypothetical protein R3185_04220 [Candidatus Thermoplasmatota archaeon]|nr:hypothetical protein [Candidatus Thermoplasmatota archaeon]